MMALSQVVLALVLLQGAKAEIDLDVQISMSGKFDESKERYLFAIEVTPAVGAPWRVMHRFNDFHSLVSDLGVEADSMEGAPFAARIQGSQEYGEFITDRRKTLEVWLQSVLRHPACQGLWKERLQKFFDPSAKVDEYLKDKVLNWWHEGKNSIWDKMGMGGKKDADTATDAPASHLELDLTQLAGISMSGVDDEVEGQRHLFAIDVMPTSGQPWQVKHRFNDFHQLRDQLGDLAKTLPGAPFPPKLQNPMKDYNEFLAERRTALAAWLQAVLKHRDIKGPWAKPLQEFLLSNTPGMYLGDDAKDKIAAWGESFKKALGQAHEQVTNAAGTVKSAVQAKYAEAKEAFDKAEILKDELNFARAKYEEAAAKVSALLQARGTGSEQVIKEATERLEGLQSDLVEAGERVQKGIDVAEHLKEDIQDLALSAAPKEDL